MEKPTLDPWLREILEAYSNAYPFDYLAVDQLIDQVSRPTPCYVCGATTEAIPNAVPLCRKCR